MVAGDTAGWSTRVNSTPSVPAGIARRPHCIEVVWPRRYRSLYTKVAGRVGAGPDLVGAGPQHHDTGEQCAANRPINPSRKRLAPVRQQGFGRTHAPRFAGGQNEPGAAHFASADRSDSSVNTDSESERQFEAALRRTAIISAVTEIAISSGEMAPISSPMGA